MAKKWCRARFYPFMQLFLHTIFFGENFISTVKEPLYYHGKAKQ